MVSVLIVSAKMVRERSNIHVQGGTLCAMRVVYLPSVHIPSMCIVGRLYLYMYQCVLCAVLPIGAGRKVITMKKQFFHKVAAEGIAMTGRYRYEYDHEKNAIHVTDTLGKVDKWVKEVDCEDYLFVKSPAAPAPKAKTTPKATPAPEEETITLTKGALSDLIAQAVAQAMAGATPAPAPKAAPKAKAKSAPKVVKPLAAHDGKLSKEGKATLKAIQAWAKKTRRPVDIQVNGSWIWVAGTEKNDRVALKELGFRWRASRQMWSWDDTRVKSA